MKINTLLCFVCSLFTVLQAQNSSPLFFSEYGEGSGNNKYLEIYNSGSESVSLADYALARTENAPTTVGEFEFWSDIFPNDASIAPGGVYVVAHTSAHADILAIADVTFGSLSNGDDGFALVMGTRDNPVYVDWVGDFNGDPGSGWPVCDDSNGTANQTLVRKCEVTSGAEWSLSSAVATCQWEVLPSNTWDSLGFHCAIPVAGCTDAAATNYSADALLDDGSCFYYTIHNINAGNFYFTDITETVYVGDQVCWFNDGGYHDVNFAASYGNPQELVDQYLSANSGGDLGCITFNSAGSFIYDCSIGDHASQGMIDTITVVEIPGPALSIKGVMDLNAPSNSDDGKAIHLVANADIPDLSLYSFNNSNNGGGSDGVEWTFPAGYSASDGDDILIYRVGTDPNFFSSYFGDCFSEFELTITNSNANSVLTMNGDDPMELFEGTDVIDNYGDVTASAINGDPYEDSWVYRSDDGTWIGPGEDGDVESNDTYSVYTSNNPYPLCSIVYGCTDSTALNFDSNAHVDTGVCNYPADIVLGCTDSTAFNFNPDATQDDESCIAVVVGCTDTTAFNHVYNANTDDGSCIAVEFGCLDENALNTDSLANTEDGSCEYPPLTNALTLQGVLDLYGNDGPNGANGNDGKAFHLKVHQDVSNLSIFSLDVVSNGTGTLNPDEFRLSGSANAGDDILVFRTDGSETFFADYFGSCYAEFELKINTGMSWPTHNGDDGTALFENYTLIDSLTLNDSVLLSGSMSGDPYEDSWAYRNEDGSWNFAGEDLDQNDNSYSVYTSGAPYPLCPDNDEPVSLTNALSLQGVLDLFGGTASISGVNGSDGDDGKAFHLKVHQDVPDLSIFSLDVVSNGSGTLNSDEFILSGSANAGDDILVYRTSGSETFFADYFGDCYSEFEIKIPTGSTFPTHNGDDGAALFENFILIDSLTLNDSVLFSGAMSGDPYEDSWAYRNDDGTWNFAGEDADQVDSTYSVYTSGAPYPLCAVVISGCTDSTAVNYNSEADEDDGSCIDLSSVPLTLQGVMDLYGSTTGNGTLGYSGTDGKAIHLVATADIPDLSLFSLGVANGGGSDGPEYALSGSANAGDDILVYRVGSAENSSNFFADYFGACYAEFEVKIATGTNFPDGNGDDPIELFQGAYVVDFYGNVDSEMPGDPYEDSWAYRNEDGSWLEGGEDCDEDDNSYSVFSSGCPYPICNVQEILGCTDTLAFNYNSFAQSSDSSCIAILEGCSDEDAENYNANANTSCLSCCEYLGCTDITALNYDENATQDDGSCVTDTATLTYALSLQGVLDLYGSGIDSLYSGLDGKAIHLVASADIADLSVFSLGVANNGEGSDGAEYHLSGSASAGDDILIYRVGSGPSSANFMSDYFGECFSEFEITFADTSGFPDGNGDDPIELFENFALIDSYGDVDGGPMLGDPYEDSWAYRNDDGSWLEGGEDCDQDDGTYTVAGSGCPYPICGIPIPGCTDSLYLEYYPAANSDDGSCSTLIVAGCTDALATNYSASANVDDNSCEYSGLTNALMIQGVMDLNGTSLSNDGKAVHLVAMADISDLSIFGIGVANNGNGTDGIEWTFPSGTSATAGDDILVYRVGTDPNFFANYFGACFSEFEHVFTDESLGSVLQQNGDDPVELFEDDVVIDNFGDVDGGAFPGDPYNDSWAYRNADSTWTYGGQNCDDEVLELGADDQTYSVYTSGCPYPMCPPPPCNAPEDWGYTVTGLNHTIVIPDTVVVSLSDGTVLSNAFVGVFFTDDNGDLICAGYEQANGSTVQIAAMGDDSTTDAVDGLVGGDGFVWMIADCNGNMFPASASYINGPEVFTPNGLSAVLSLTEIPAGPSDQVLKFPSGWSMFSTYMVAADMNLINLLTPIISNVIIAKDYLGAAYLPEWNFNGIGELALGQGYQIKTEAADSITIAGDYAFPEDNPIDIVAGWNMIGYLRTESAAADAVLATINATGNLIIAKNYLGAAYLPEWNFNGIGSMEPGQGYQIKVTNADVLQYLSNDESYRMSTVKVTENNVSHFAKVVPTDNNMTVVIEDAAWDVLPSKDAEIAAFDKDGNLVGSAIYSSPVTVIAVWGDDATTASKDGLFVSEAVSFKVWNTNGDLRDFKVSKWIEGASSYQVDAINIASSIETHTIMTELDTSERVLVKVINVLGQEVNMDDEPFKGTVLFKVYDDGSVDRFVK